MSYKSAIIGYGGMGEWHHKNIRERIPQIEVTGAYDVREEARNKAVQNGLNVYSSLEDLLKDENIDLVTIATPNNFHKDISIKAMEHGKHVVCEKPVTMNAGELEEIMEAARKFNRLFSVHQNRRWDKDYRIVKEIIKNNMLGEPYFIENRVQGSRRSLHGWRGYKINGGGMVLDWGVHLIDQMLDLIPSKVTEIYANLCYIYSSEVDDNFKMMMKFENGVSALIEVATNCFINLPRWHVTCKEGTAEVKDWSCQGKMVKLFSDEEMTWDDDIVYTEAGPTRTMAPRPKHTMQEIDLPEVQTDWSDYYKNIVGALNGSEELIVKPEQSLRVMKVIDAVFESADKGASIKCRI